MLLKSEHKEGGGSRDTMEQSELSQAMETKKRGFLFLILRYIFIQIIIGSEKLTGDSSYVRV